jgi:hypothetical protein
MADGVVSKDELKQWLHDRYSVEFTDKLDELRTAQRAGASADQITQVSNIEKRANICTDALQLYLALLKFAQPPETLQVGEASVLGGVGNRASDELWLIKAKNALRNALAWLAEAAQAG